LYKTQIRAVKKSLVFERIKNISRLKEFEAYIDENAHSPLKHLLPSPGVETPLEGLPLTSSTPIEHAQDTVY
jgi:hypothetical protein